MSAELITYRQQAEAVVATIEPTQGNYQVPYPNRQGLIGTLSVLPTIEPVATPKEIWKLRDTDAAIATGRLVVPKLTVGHCAELLVSEFDITMLEAIANGEADPNSVELPSLGGWVGELIAMEDVAYDVLGPDASVEERAAGQFAKPRSEFMQTLKDGSQVYSYFGDSINSRDETRRQPNPSRLIAARLQSLRTKELMLARGRSPIFAHEALSLAYESMAICVDEETGDRYIGSGHKLWLGNRTNDPNGEHARLLTGIINPVGVKIGPDSSSEHIARLVELLNPNGEPGKLTFMIRVGLEHRQKLTEIAKAIARYAPNQLQVDDIHAHTVQREHGGKRIKIRSVEHTIETIKATHDALAGEDLELNGFHIEAKGRVKGHFVEVFSPFSLC